MLWLVAMTLGCRLALPAVGQSSGLAGYVSTCPFISADERATLADSLAHHPEAHRLTISTSSLSTVTMELLPLVYGTQLMVVLERIDEPTQDSYLCAYTADWKLIEGARLIEPMPTPELFLQGIPLDTPEAIRLRQLLHPLYLDMHLEDGRLVVRPSLPQSLDDRQNSGLQTLIAGLSPLTYVWHERGFTFSSAVR